MTTATVWDGPFDLGPFFKEQSFGHTRVRIKVGDVIWTQGDTAESLLYVETGWIKITSVQSSGREAVLGLRRPGEIVGTRSLIKHRPRLGTASALTDGSILSIDRTSAWIGSRSSAKPCWPIWSAGTPLTLRAWSNS